MLENMTWLNEPREWSVSDGVLRATTESRTDFWRATFYGWTTDNGHFRHRPVTGDFTASVIVSAEHTTRFGTAVTVHYRTGDHPWRLLRLGHLDLPETVSIGVMCCSPERAGLNTTFRDFHLGPPIPRDDLE